MRNKLLLLPSVLVWKQLLVLSTVSIPAASSSYSSVQQARGSTRLLILLILLANVQVVWSIEM